MNFDDQDVLVIGDKTFNTAALALEKGASLVEVIPAKQGAPDEVSKLLGWDGRASAGNVQVRNVAGTTLEDENSWDDVVISGVGQAEFPEVMRRAQRACRGQVRVFKNAVDWEGEKKAAVLRPPSPVELDLAERKVMLHVHNVRRCGGTGNFVYDMARCFPQFVHVALCVNDPSGDPDWIRDVSNVMQTMYAPQVTQDLLDEINPRVVVLHATVGAKVAGAWPYPWLQDGGKRFVIRLHHIPTHPILPADLSVFVSEFVKGRYAAFLDVHISRHIVMPPCTDLAPYAAIPHRTSFPLSATTGGKACPEMQAMQELAHWAWDSRPPGRIGQFAAYLGRFPFAVIWSGLQETWCRTVTEALAAGCVVVAHRAGAIPEQIEHGVNGYLFDTGAELTTIMAELAKKSRSSPARLAQVAVRGRAWAVENAGFERMRAALYPFLTEALMEA